MEAEASISTEDDSNDEQPDDLEDSDGDIHARDEHFANPEDRKYTYSYLDVMADWLSRFRLYIFLLFVLFVVAAWYYGLPRWTWFAGGCLLFASAATWRYVFDYISRLDDGLDNIFLELFPEDGADHHAFEVGDGVVPDFDNDGVPAYPVRGVTDVFEVEKFLADVLEYEGSPRAALPYSEYVDVELRGRYHRDEIVPLADEVPRLRARLHAQSVRKSTEETVENVELIEKALRGDLEPKTVPNPLLDGDDETGDTEAHASRVEHQQNGDPPEDENDE
jgi:hypothetical protein